MIQFPESTVFGRKIPKKSFYKNLGVDRRLEELFVQEIQSITWAYKLAPDTINISEGAEVKEIQVIEILLKKRGINKRVLEFLDREIPYHILFVLKYGQESQLWISYKEMSKSKGNRFKVDSLFHTEWIETDKISIALNGLNFDSVYESFIQQISDGEINVLEADTLKEAVELSKEKKKIMYQIDKVNNKMKTEKQFNRQLEYKHTLIELQRKLESL